MLFEPNNIISRIEWCRLEQQLPSATPEERESWQAEEAGLVDALFGRDRIAFIRAEHPSHLTRYQRGLEDGHALLCVQQFNSRGHDTYGGVGLSLLMLPAQVARRPVQTPPLVQLES